MRKTAMAILTAAAMAVCTPVIPIMADEAKPNVETELTEETYPDVASEISERLADMDANTMGPLYPDAGTRLLLSMATGMRENTFYLWKTEGAFNSMILRKKVYKKGEKVDEEELDEIILPGLGMDEGGLISLTSDDSRLEITVSTDLENPDTMRACDFNLNMYSDEPDAMDMTVEFQGDEEGKTTEIEDGKELPLAAYYFGTGNWEWSDVPEIVEDPENAFANTEVGYLFTVEFVK